MRALLVVALVATSAYADTGVTVESVRDPDSTVKPTDVARALDATKQTAWCTPKADLLGWVVFENGKVTTADVGGGADRKTERCIVTLLKRAKLDMTKKRVVATLIFSPASSAGDQGKDDFSNPFNKR